MKRPALVFLLAATPWMFDAAAMDTGVVRVSPAVAYLDDGVGTPEVRQDCDWNRRTIAYLIHDSRGRVEVFDGDLDQAGGKTLSLVATGIHAIGGGGFTGPKWVKIRGELKLDGKVINNFEVTSHSVGLDTACETLQRIARQLGAYTARWLARPQNHAPAAAADEDPPLASKDEPVVEVPGPPPALAPAASASPPAATGQ
jgi:hypothetical protein